MLLPRLLAAVLVLSQRVEGGCQLPQRLGVLFLLAPHRPRLQVNLLSHCHHLPKQCVQIDLARSQ